MKYEISVIGSFGAGHSLNDGQTIKTKELSKLLLAEFGANNVNIIDTYGWNKIPWRFFYRVIKASRLSKIVILLPAQCSVRILPVLVLLFRTRSTKIYYSVIGGWLHEFLKNKPILMSTLRKLSGIWVETKLMKAELEKYGFHNVDIIPNFKNLRILKFTDVPPYESPYLRLCIFSRVQEMKGVSMAISTIAQFNQKRGKIVYTLDIYGPIDRDYKDTFKNMCETNKSFVKYGGVIDAEKSTEVIKDYFALLFPTLYSTEGIPGTIIDAYSAGLPVIAAQWQNFTDIIDEGITGFGYELGNRDALYNILERIADSPDMILRNKNKCIDKARYYTPDAVLNKILSIIRY